MKLLFLCPLLAAGQLVASVGSGGPSFGRYPGYSGNYNITGTVAITNNGGGTYQFDANLMGGALSANHTFHIHTGVSCASASGVGGHLWAPFNVSDPWTVPFLTADASGNISGSFQVSFGYTEEIFIGHAMVVHDPAGVRTACGIISAQGTNKVPSYQSVTLTPYPGYNGTLIVNGTVEVWDLDNISQIVNFRVKGLNSNVAGGVHIHVGKSCANSSGHYWTPSPTPDPWLTTMYISSASGLAEGSFKIASGYLLADNIHHAVVIHDFDNTRVACGLLGGAEVVPPTCPTTAIQGVFTACKAYDFSGTSSCTQSCSTSLATMVSAFTTASIALPAAQACIDTSNTATPWVNGDVPTLKQRLNFNGVPFCNVTAPTTATNDAAVVSGSVLAAVLPFFFF